MYKVGFRDRVEELATAPQSDVGAPLPMVLADEDRVFLAYRVSEPDPHWDGSYTNIVSPDTSGTIAIVSFNRCSVHMFGPPNDEAFGGHPLAKRGLRPYAAWEVHHSSWLALRIKMNRIHPRHSDRLFSDLRHFIFAFHDSTFECLAKDFTASLFRGSMNDAVARMAALLAGSE